jgi:hypothetical protein
MSRYNYFLQVLLVCVLEELTLMVLIFLIFSLNSLSRSSLACFSGGITWISISQPINLDLVQRLAIERQ